MDEFNYLFIMAIIFWPLHGTSIDWSPGIQGKMRICRCRFFVTHGLEMGVATVHAPICLDLVIMFCIFKKLKLISEIES